MSPIQRLMLAGVLVAIGIIAVASLLKGADYLLWPIGPFPLGNLLTTAGLASFPAAAWLYAGERRWLRRLALVAVFVGLQWYPTSIMLSGNLYLNFSGDRGISWWGMTVTSVLLSLLVPLIVVCLRLFDALRQKAP